MLGGGDWAGENRDRGGSSGSNGDGGGGGGGHHHTSLSGAEGLFLNILRRLESIDVLGEDAPTGVQRPADAGSGESVEGSVGAISGVEGGSNNGVDADGGLLGVGSKVAAGRDSGSSSGVGSSLAGVGAKLRFKFRKPSGFGLPATPSGRGGGWVGGGGSGGGGTSEEIVGDGGVGVAAGTGAGADGGGNAFVEGASKALAMNRDRVMGWMKELRPKDLPPQEASRKGEIPPLEHGSHVHKVSLLSPSLALSDSLNVSCPICATSA